MSNNEQKKILVALDGSENSFAIINYISKLPAFKKIKINLFNIFNTRPILFLDIERELQYTQRTREIVEWRMHQLENQKNYMEKARQALLNAGFSDDLISINISELEIGIARDIIKESKDEYCAVAIGRKGMNPIKVLLMGSVAMKLIEKLSFIPLMMVDKDVASPNFLIAIDGSEGSMKAVDFMAQNMVDPEQRIALVHIIRGENFFSLSNPFLFSPKESIEDVQEKIMVFFKEARKKFIDAGFKDDKVSTKIITGVNSRAEAIVEEAKANGYGTIVIGRRGLSKVEEFSIGRVSNKIIHLAREQAVWII